MKCRFHPTLVAIRENEIACLPGEKHRGEYRTISPTPLPPSPPDDRDLNKKQHISIEFKIDLLNLAGRSSTRRWSCARSSGSRSPVVVYKTRGVERMKITEWRMIGRKRKHARCSAGSDYNPCRWKFMLLPVLRVQTSACARVDGPEEKGEGRKKRWKAVFLLFNHRQVPGTMNYRESVQFRVPRT